MPGAVPDRSPHLRHGPRAPRSTRGPGAHLGHALPTHAEALAHALAEVGLTPTNPEEQP